MICLYKKIKTQNEKMIKILGIEIKHNTYSYTDSKKKYLYGLFKVRADKTYNKIRYYILGIKICERRIEKDKFQNTIEILKTINNNIIENRKQIQTIPSLVKENKKQIDNVFYNQQVLSQVKALHKVFASYKRKHEGQNVVLIACGPTIKKFVPLKNAIYVGVNGACRFNIPLDYLFLTDLIKNDLTVNDEIDNYTGNNCKKFYAILPQKRLTQVYATCNVDRIPQTNLYCANAVPFLLEDIFSNKWAVDLENEPLGDFGGSVFSALQFILWTNPDKIYIAGCDCNSGYAYDNKSLLADHSGKVNGFRKFKDFASRMYPETEIISVNPIGLKGLFKDIYTNKTGDGYYEK